MTDDLLDRLKASVTSHLAASHLNGLPWPAKGSTISTACGRIVNEALAAPYWKGSVADSWITCPDCAAVVKTR